MVTSMLLVALLSVDAGPRSCGGGRAHRGHGRAVSCGTASCGTGSCGVSYAPSSSSCTGPMIVGTTVVQPTVIQPTVIQPTVIQPTVSTCSSGTCQPIYTGAPVYGHGARSHGFARGGCSSCR